MMSWVAVIVEALLKSISTKFNCQNNILVMCVYVVCDVRVKFCIFTTLHEKSSCLDLPWPVGVLARFCVFLEQLQHLKIVKGWCLHMPVIQWPQDFNWQVQVCHLSILQIYPPLVKDGFQASKSLDSLHDLPLIRGIGRQKLGESRSKPPVSLVSFTSQVRNNGQCRSSSLTIKSAWCYMLYILLHFTNMPQIYSYIDFRMFIISFVWSMICIETSAYTTFKAGSFSRAESCRRFKMI